MARVNNAQMKKLLELMSRDGILVNGQVDYRRITKQTFWKQIAMQLNAIEGGGHKNAWKWCKTWSDWKNNTKRKAAKIVRRKGCNTESSGYKDMTAIEIQLLKLMGSTVPYINELGLPSEVTKKENDDDMQFENVELEYFVEDFKPTSDNEVEITHTLIDNYKPSANEKAPSNCGDDTDEEQIILENLSEKSHDWSPERKLRKGEKMKTDIQESNNDMTTVILEKEKISQRREELRLKAIELKLRSEELRLQEKEMNKVNNLVNIEEEKLKCFREISASLKELLERTKNGNQRFPNVI